MDWVHKLALLNVFLVIMQFFILSFIVIDRQETGIPLKIFFVVSKPTDLFRYFGPTITKANNSFVLSLSPGGSNLTQAQSDFSTSCSIVGIKTCIINTYNPESFQDDKWRIEDIKSAIQYYIDEIKPNITITYDSNGMNDKHNSKVSKALTPERLNVSDMPLSKISKMVQHYNNRALQTSFNNFNLDNVSLLLLQTPSKVLKFSGFFSIFASLKILRQRSNSVMLISSPIASGMYRCQQALSVFEGEGTFINRLLMLHMQASYVNKLVLPTLTDAA